MAILKKLKSADDAAEDPIAVLQRRLAELDARDRTLTKKILDGEASPASKNAHSNSLATAEALLDGKLFDARVQFPLSDLVAVRAERDSVRLATKIGLDRLARLMEARANEVTASFLGEITQVERQRVSAALALQKVNRQREALRDKIRDAGGNAFLPTDGAALLEIGDRDDEVRWAIERVIADGIMTAVELERMKADE
jgi:hypothetical protein